MEDIMDHYDHRRSIEAWLGDARGELTEEQLDTLIQLEDAIDAMNLPEDSDLAGARLTGGAEVILGDDTVQQMALAYTTARREAEDARLRLAGAVLAASMCDVDLTEADLCDMTGMSRNFVRTCLGRSAPR